MALNGSGNGEHMNIRLATGQFVVGLVAICVTIGGPLVWTARGIVDRQDSLDQRLSAHVNSNSTEFGLLSARVDGVSRKVDDCRIDIRELLAKK